VSERGCPQGKGTRCDETKHAREKLVEARGNANARAPGAPLTPGGPDTGTPSLASTSAERPPPNASCSYYNGPSWPTSNTRIMSAERPSVKWKKQIVPIIRGSEEVSAAGQIDLAPTLCKTRRGGECVAASTYHSRSIASLRRDRRKAHDYSQRVDAVVQADLTIGPKIGRFLLLWVHGPQPHDVAYRPKDIAETYATAVDIH